ncbi:MAG: Gldg family protein [Chloroflexota bacterium]
MIEQIRTIANKELRNYFGSPLALIFLGTFLAAVLFIFFTFETFFARNLADVRPMFVWMPVLLIFLIAALTMRQWSEEERSGTRELLLTLPVSPWSLVLGKFSAVLTLIGVALLLTLPIPITVNLMGNLDWGPVIGGYIAAFLLAAAYGALGLFVSSRTDNQIVALIVTVILGGLIYLVGTRSVTDLFGGGLSEILWAIGTGSRFESIQRGVLDIRDLIYYLYLTGIFLTLNVISLDSIRWSEGQVTYRQRQLLTAGLIVANLILLNVWIFPLSGLRYDMTEQKEFSLSAPTRDLIGAINEPMVIRAYISENNHPLLLPLVPQIRDMLREYEIASDGMITAEVVDPISDPELELEANQRYGIQPQPFQITGQYEASVINAYFDILISFGDQVEIVSFQDLIEVTPTPIGTDVSLRNLEYDLTSNIKKVIFGFQSIDTILAAYEEPARLTYYVTSSTLPEDIIIGTETINAVANDIAQDAGGQFLYQIIDLDASNSPVTQNDLLQLGLQPIPLGLFASETFYAHMVLEAGGEGQLLYPPADITEGSVRTLLESALKRTAPGFLKSVGIWSPQPAPANPQFGGAPPAFVNYNVIGDQLSQEYTVQPVDLNREVPADIDVLVVNNPQSMNEAQIFALDQFLMRGGSIMISFSHYSLSVDQFSGAPILQPAAVETFVPWLEHHGVEVGRELVMDLQNQPFPTAVQRQVQGIQVQEIQAIDYPFFVDVRPDGMNEESPILSGLPALTLNWPSTVEFNETVNEGRQVDVLVNSSPESWLRTDTNILPDLESFPDVGFPIGQSRQSYPLGISIQGSFNSYFSDREIPVNEAAAATAEGGTQLEPVAFSKINESPESSRLVVVGSATFTEDNILQLSSQLTGDRYLANLQFVQNVVDWSVEDLDLLSIRSRGSVTRVLIPLEESGKQFWTVANYVVIFAALLAVYFFIRTNMRRSITLDPPPNYSTGGGD